MNNYFQTVWNITNFIFLICFVAIFSWPLSSPFDAYSVFLPKLPPSFTHPFGTDIYGTDLLLQLAEAVVINVKYGLSASVPYLIFGITFGLILGYADERNNPVWNVRKISISFIRGLANTMTEIFQSLPAALVVVLGILVVNNVVDHPSFRIYFVMVLYGFACIPGLVYSIRDEVVRLKRMEFIHASKALGVSMWRLIVIDILWFSCGHIIISKTVNIFLSAIAIEIFSTVYMSSSVVTLGTLIGNTVYQFHATILICMIFFCLRWFAERITIEMDG
jgi:peptide/nickel transport system permease protein